MRNLGEDIVLLAIRQNGGIIADAELSVALAGSELVRLAALGRIRIVDGRVEATDRSPTGDERLDAALDLLSYAVPAPDARAWVSRARPAIVRVYLQRLAAAGTVLGEDRKVLGLFRVHRWIVVDAARLDDARTRLDAVVYATGDVTEEQAAYAALVHAAGLGAVLYPGRKGTAARARLEESANGGRTVDFGPRAGDGRGAKGSGGSPPEYDSLTMSTYLAAVRASVDATCHAVAQHHAGHHGGFGGTGSGGGDGGHHHTGGDFSGGHGGGFSGGGHHG